MLQKYSKNMMKKSKILQNEIIEELQLLSNIIKDRIAEVFRNYTKVFYRENMSSL